MKLKKLLKESNVWDRKFGESLPTLKDTTARYAAKQNLTEKTGGQKTYKSLMKLEKVLKNLIVIFLKIKEIWILIELKILEKVFSNYNQLGMIFGQIFRRDK